MSREHHPARDRLATRVVHAGNGPDGESGALVPPLPMSVVFGHGNSRGYAYGRDHNENWERLEGALTDLEEGLGAVVFSSGMAAISAVVESCGIGPKVVVAQDAYLGSRELLGHLSQAGRCTTELVEATDLEAVHRACQDAALLLIESLGNPLLTVPDLQRCAELARAAGAITLVDNTFTTPLLVQPLRLGADAVVHSVSKYIGGHSDLMLGAVITNDSDLLSNLRYQRTNAGAIPGHLETWLALRGLRTLDVRLRRQTATAAQLADRLQGLPGVLRVHYPGLASHPQHELAVRQMKSGFGAMLAVELDCGADAAERVCRATRIWTNSTSLGSVESLLERRGRWAGEEYLPAGLIRLSVGVEDPEDLLQDLTQALAQVGPREAATQGSGGRPPAG
ncbi:MAG: PLP-dependent aspartate aminotransferase family protein [Candidatus Dormiibacterota bacterium]